MRKRFNYFKHIFNTIRKQPEILDLVQSPSKNDKPLHPGMVIEIFCKSMNVIYWWAKLYIYYMLTVYESASLQEETSPHSQCLVLGRPHHSSMGPSIGDTERWRRQRPSSPMWLWCHMSPLPGVQQPSVVSALSGVLDTWGSFRLTSVSSSWRALETFMPGAAWDQPVFDMEKRRLGGRWQSWCIWRDGHGTEELDSLSPSPRVGT